jgi:diguanylate cyclase (GGDEF)-like protein
MKEAKGEADVPHSRQMTKRGRAADPARHRLGRRAGQSGGPARVWALIGALGLAGLALWLAVAQRLVPVAPVTRVPWPLLAVAFAATELLVVHFEFRQETEFLTLSEVPLAVGLVFTPAAWVLVACVLGCAVAQIGVRRQAPQKAAFNLLNNALMVGAAATVFRFLLPGASPVSARGWLTVAAAVLAADVVSYSTVLLVIWLTAGRPKREAVVPLLVAGAVVVVTNSTLALLAICVLWVNPASVWLLVIVSAVFALGYRSHESLRRRFASLDLLYGFTRRLSAATPDTGEVESVILADAARMLRANEARLVLTAPGGCTTVAWRDGSLARESSAEPGALAGYVLRTGAPVMVARPSRTTRAARSAGNGGPSNGAELVAADGWRDALACPLAGDADPTGVLLVADRQGELTTFDSNDLRLFEALANHASVALDNDLLLERLRQQVVARGHQALHDALTGLPNRLLFSERVDGSCRECPPGAVVAVLLMDLDRFKDVNDTLGHHTGDALLRQIAARLVQAVDAHGLVARLGGDEFAVVLPAGDENESLRVAAAIVTAVERPVEIDDLVLEVQVSMGVAFAPQHGTEASTLLQRADVAMYAAKGAQRGPEVYAPERDSYSPRRLALVSELRQAIESGRLEVYYQPKARLPAGQVFGAEALARWSNPRHGMVPPDEFIPLAEQSGLIRPLTVHVMRTALAQVGRWRRQGLDLSIAINLSARSLLDPGMVDEIRVLIERSGVPPGAIILELTESSVMADTSRSVGVWNALAAIGVQLSIDDFGTGYSSLSRLRRLPVDEVKIDRCFVLNMVNDVNDEAIVRSTIDLAANLGLRAVAEGVEDWGTWDRLARLGCGAAQGFLLSPALPAAEFERWLPQWNRRPFRPRLVTSAGYSADAGGAHPAQPTPRPDAAPQG